MAAPPVRSLRIASRPSRLVQKIASYGAMAAREIRSA